MNTQPEALRLADELDGIPLTDFTEALADDAAAELRRLHAETTNQQDWLVEWRKCADEAERLHALNAELLEALKSMVQLDEEEHQRGGGDIDICKEVQDAYAAIAKAESEKKNPGVL